MSHIEWSTCMGGLHTREPIKQPNLGVKNANMSSYSSSCYSNKRLFCFCQQQFGAFSRGNSSLLKTESATAHTLRPLWASYSRPSICPSLISQVRIPDSGSDCVRIVVWRSAGVCVSDRLTWAFCRHPTWIPAASSLPGCSPFKCPSISLLFSWSLPASLPSQHL